MINKRMIKIFVITYFVNLAENLLILLFFNVKITKTVLIGAGVFSLVVTLIIEKLILKEEKE